MRRILLSTLFIAILMLAACTSASTSQDAPAAGGSIGKKIQAPGGEYTDVSVGELRAMLENKDFVFVNVHVPFEGNIPDTDLSIPYDQIDQHLDELPADKGAKIVLYCRSDRMSNIAAETLVGLGYTNVWNLDGGFNDWENSGLPLEK
jgi:rhodanese-related sulfurtransferase